MTFKTRLLQGVTGSGKTEVYFEAMENAFKQGGSILFLVPEVTLALANRFAIKDALFDLKK